MRPTAHSSPRARLRELLPLTPLLAVLIAAALAAILASNPGTVAIYVAVLAATAGMLGWRAGEGRREALQHAIDDQSGELHRALTELEVAQGETVRRLSMAVEFRDEDTGAHIERIGRFSTLLAERVGVERELCERLAYAAPLHDVGKVAIPDSILLKPGALTPEERAIVETHTEEGYRLLAGSSSSILDMAATIALSHHERWDGDGYPRGLAGEAIPIEGRIVAVADVFDALTSDRVYRAAYSLEQAVQMMRAQRGAHFDPALLDAFLEVLARVGPHARRLPNADPDALLKGVAATYLRALERGDAETAEGAIAQAIDDGVPVVALPEAVIEPALRRLGELSERGMIAPQRERAAMVIARRVLATLRRYAAGHREEPQALARIDAAVALVEERLERAESADELAARRDTRPAGAQPVG